MKAFNKFEIVRNLLLHVATLLLVSCEISNLNSNTVNGENAGEDTQVVVQPSAGDQAGVEQTPGINSPPTQTIKDGCTIQIESCPAMPDTPNIVQDDFDGSATSVNRCMYRAIEWREECKSKKSVSAKYSKNGKILATNISNPLPELTIELAQPIQEQRIYTQNINPQPYAEIPPITLQGGWKSYIITTSYSWMCSSPDSILEKWISIPSYYCNQLQGPLTLTHSNGFFGDSVPASNLNGAKSDWKRNYSGIMSAHITSDQVYSKKVIAVVHGENKNEKLGDNYYQNTVNTNVLAKNCASGLFNNSYSDCWDAYNGFISLSATPYNREYNWGSTLFSDFGPAIWPSAGYVNGDQKLSWGVRHPSSIIKDGYLYIVYLDTSAGNSDGRKSGIKIARAPLSDQKVPTGFIPYHRGAFSENNKSLPPGFDPYKVRDFYESEGGAADELWPNSSNVNRFSIAKIRGTNLYAGVEEVHSDDGLSWFLRLRLSDDLVNWSSPKEIPGTRTSGGWDAGVLHYPIFSDWDNTTNYEIDADGFYILGTHNSNPYQKAIKIELSE